METESLSKYADAEEGEILDDPDELYTPLERPHVSAVPAVGSTVPSPPESDAEKELSSDSDSDSSTKKLNLSKIRRKEQHFQAKPTTVKKKSYNIWCSDLQTEVLTNCLVDCNVDQSNERGRDVESYNYRLGMASNENKFKEGYLSSESGNKKKYSAKRKHDGAYVGEKAKTEEPDNQKKPQLSTNHRNILGLSTNFDNSEEEIARDVANKLCEEKEDLILRAISILGKEAVFSLFEETKEIEASGGMLVMNGTRRRTPGGVFFYLLKTSETLPREKINLVLAEDKKSKAEEKKLSGKKLRKIRAEKFKEALSKDDFPTLLSRTELAIKEFKARKLAEDSAEVKNPPPSPATDGRDCSSDGEKQKEGSAAKGAPERRTLTTYDDNIFGNEEDTMDFS